MGLKALSIGSLLLAFSSAALADELVVPPCVAYGRDLPVNNQQVLHWKRTTANQFRERGHISGEVVDVYPDRNGHEHFVINIGTKEEDTIEVIYNQDFGAMPEPKPGMKVEACGDYITSTAKSGPYPPSPVGAIIHWVHANPKGRGHESGFVVMDGILYGQDPDHAGPKPSRPGNGKPRPHFLSAEY